MCFSSPYGQWCFFPELLFECLDNVVNYSAVDMRYFHMINVPDQGTLLTFNLLICNAPIVWIDDDVENSSSLFFQISCSQGILNGSRMSYSLLSRSLVYMYLSQLMRTSTKLSKMHCHLVLTFHILILRMSEYRNPTIKHISTYTLVSSSINTYVTDLFLGSNPHSKIPF